MKAALLGLCVMLVSLSSVAQSWRDNRARLFTGKLTVRFRGNELPRSASQALIGYELHRVTGSLAGTHA